MKKKKINMGEMIMEQFFACAMKKNGTLIFPCLIMELCLQQVIDYHPGEGLEKNPGSIDMNCILRLYSNSKS